MDAPNFRVDGKVALITGAGRGIGLGMAQGLASAGATVVIQDIELEVATAAAQAIVAEGGKALALGGDLTDLTLPERLVKQTVEQAGGIDILINNGAIQSSKHWLEMPLEEMKLQFDTDLVSPILFCRAAVPYMKAKKWGRIINLGSIQQRSANPHMLPYSLCKGSMEKLTKALGRDLARDKITVNCIAPGWINTYRNRHDFKDAQDVVEKGKHVPLGRVGEPYDFAGIVVLLCSSAGEYITGQNIFVDGGFSTH
jgi:NAD(P)-dependent dehydrogenase (short-subunit alcohol dehydrogenase family)